MLHGIQCLRAFGVCQGSGLVLGRVPVVEGPPTAAAAGTGLVLATILGERDASGDHASTVVLRLSHRDDAGWVLGALDWLVARGRRAIVRTPVVLSKALCAEAKRCGATVVLELADHRPEIARALLGTAAEPASALLLHAQYLRASGIDVVAQIGPLMPVLHDRGGHLEALVRHVAAADITEAHLTVGRLPPARHAALAEVLPWGDVAALERRFADRGDGSLQFEARTGLYRRGLRLARDAGLRVDHCGCPAQCHLDPGTAGPYVPLTTPELFPNVG